MSQSYVIKRMQSPDFANAPVAPIDKTVWIDNYKPETTAQLIYDTTAEAFVARLVCVESDPLARFTSFGDPVCRDSCMEWFCCFDTKDGRYVNFETNANGALQSSLGFDRHGRIRINQFLSSEELPKIVIEKAADRWSATITVKKSSLEKIYGHPLSFDNGTKLIGNFYKCGDETKTVHYIMWNPVGTEQPDYHRPEYFGELLLQD